MGGHSAWRKRVENGELAKGYAGAACRHRPHLGRKGKDLIKNRKGWIGGGNPKKSKNVRPQTTGAVDVNTAKDVNTTVSSSHVQLMCESLLVCAAIAFSTWMIIQVQKSHTH